MLLKTLIENPADFLNPYWYERLGGINWCEDGKSLTLSLDGRPVWNPNFRPSVFLNHGIKRIHILPTPSDPSENLEISLKESIQFFSNDKKEALKKETHFETQSFLSLQKRLEKSEWIALPEGKGISFFFKKEMSEFLMQKISDFAKEKKWVLIFIEKVYDLP
jgi:hypothetical protein